MPNQLPSPKELLKSQSAVPKGIEDVLPKGLPSMAKVLANIADALPDIPALPAMAAAPTFPGGVKVPTGVEVKNFLKSVEDILPGGAPKASAAISNLQNTTGYREAPAGEKATTKRGGGYRPIP